MIEMTPQEREIIELGVVISGTMASGFLGVLLGGWITTWNKRIGRKRTFSEKQLREFLAPISAIHEEIQLYSNSVFEDDDTNESNGDSSGPEIINEDVEEKSENKSFKMSPSLGAALNQRDHEKLIMEQILPAYERIASVFRENLWLADQELRKHYRTLIEFLQRWRKLTEELPDNIMEKLHQTQKELVPFFDLINLRLEKLHKQLKKG